MNYEVPVHRRFGESEEKYVYLSASASIVRLDSLSEEIFDYFGGPSGANAPSWLSESDDTEAAAEKRETLSDMIAMGMIRPVGEIRPPGPDLPPMPFPLATLVLNVTNKCNLSCTYCYEYGEDKLTEGKAPATPKPASMMATETAKESIDFLLRSAADRSGVTITFFGGETLLNFDTIREATMYAESEAAKGDKKVNFALTTNATLLDDDIIDFLIEHRFGVNISIDGDREAHDEHRRFKSGLGSYDLIVPRIKKLLERNRKQPGGRPIGARVTVTTSDTGLQHLFRHLTEELGFDDVGFAPVTSAPGRDYALDGPDYQKLLDEFGVLANEYVECAVTGRRHGFSNLGDLLRELHQGVNKAHPCGAGLGLLGVSTEGELGLCHRFVESGDHAVGNVRDGVDEEKRTDFLRQGHVENKADCATCFARPVCAGGCYHEAQVRYGDASKANLHYCDYIRAWTQMGFDAYSRIMDRNPAFFDAYERSGA